MIKYMYSHDHKTIACQCGRIIQNCYCKTSDKEYIYVHQCDDCSDNGYRNYHRLSMQEGVSLFLQWVDKTKDNPQGLYFYSNLPGLGSIAKHVNTGALYLTLRSEGLIDDTTDHKVIEGRYFNLNYKIYTPALGEW